MRWLGRTYLAIVLMFLYAPIAVLVAMGLNASPLYALPFRFSTVWYERLAGNAKLLAASWNSLAIAGTTAAVATVFGTMAAVALSRRAFRGRAILKLLLLPPIAIPWLITGTAMLVFFFYAGIGRGVHAILIGHVALAIPYVVLVVGTGLATVRRNLEEAAMSLGSRPAAAFLRVTLPALWPSIAGAAFFAFAVSLDQFVVSYFLATPGSSTLPVEIYSAIRKGFTPEINAICTILLGASMAVFAVFAVLSRPGAARDGR